MGGPCDEAMTSETKEGMMEAGMVHLEASHPEMAASVKAMAKDDPKMTEWQASFDKAWDEAADDEA